MEKKPDGTNRAVPSPLYMDEYQNKGVAEFAFRKCMKSSGHPFGVVV